MMSEPEKNAKKEIKEKEIKEPEDLYKEWLELKHFYLDKSVFSTVLMFIGVLYAGLNKEQAAIPDAKHIVVNIIVLLVVALIVSYMLFSALREINNLILFIPEDNLPNFEDVVDKIFREAGWMLIFVIITLVFLGLIFVFILPQDIQNQVLQLIYPVSFIPLAPPYFYGVKSYINIYYKIYLLKKKTLNNKGVIASIFILIILIGVICSIISHKNNVDKVVKFFLAFYWLPVFVFLVFFLIRQYFKMRKHKSANKQK